MKHKCVLYVIERTLHFLFVCVYLFSHHRACITKKKMNLCECASLVFFFIFFLLFFNSRISFVVLITKRNKML